MKDCWKKNNKGGFTLMEIMLVIALIAGLAALVGGKVFKDFAKGRKQVAAIGLKQLESALDRYRLDCNRYPSTEQGLEALVIAPTAAPPCQSYDPQGYLSGNKKVPMDPWSHPYDYKCEDGLNYTLRSFGADGVEGGDADNADISSDDG